MKSNKNKINTESNNLENQAIDFVLNGYANPQNDENEKGDINSFAIKPKAIINPVSSSAIKHKDKKNNQFFLKYNRGSFSDKYGWNFIQRMIAWTLFVIVIVVSVFYMDFPEDEKGEIIHGFKHLDEKPTTSNSLMSKIGAIPTTGNNSDEMINYALSLYEVGNLGMMTSDYSGIYLSGYSNSVNFLIGDLPLIIESVEVKDNIKGESLKFRAQVIDAKNADSKIALLARAFGAEMAEMKYHNYGDEQVSYYTTTKFISDGEKYSPNWNSLGEIPSVRKDILLTPTPFVAASVSSLIEKNIGNLTYKKHGDKYVPYYTNGGAKEMTYEITDQHFEYVGGSSTYDTVTYASVKHNANGYYEVEMKINTKIEYATIDTAWSIRDSKSTNSENANYTKIELKFQLWDNGYFKQAELYENWYCRDAEPLKGVNGKMSADQYYKMRFTYDKEDCDSSRFKFWNE